MVDRKEKSTALEQVIAAKLNNRRAHSTIRQLSINPPEAVDFSSNDFLSFATSQDLAAEYQNELSKYVHQLGSGGSRLLDGNSHYAEETERMIATFHNAPAGLLCNSGFDANVSLFSTLPQPGDFILYDELIHASVHDGMKLSRAAKGVAFKHNDIADLEIKLEECIANDGVREGRLNVFIAIEAVYSMDGDVAPLRATVDLLRRALPMGNGHLIVDEAHSTGVFGPEGRGLVCELGLEDSVTIRLHTFGKAMACNGAAVLCSPLIKEYLLNYARPLIFTTFMSHPCIAAIRASYTLLQTDKTQSRIQHLATLIAHLHRRLRDLYDVLRLASPSQRLLRLPPATGQSAISYVMTPRPKELAAFCRGRGLIVRGIVPPTVPAGTERIRICLHAGNTAHQVDELISAIRTWVEMHIAQEPNVGAVAVTSKL